MGTNSKIERKKIMDSLTIPISKRSAFIRYCNRGIGEDSEAFFWDNERKMWGMYAPVEDRSRVYRTMKDMWTRYAKHIGLKITMIDIDEVLGVKMGNDIIQDILKKTSLETRINVSLEMSFISLLVELGYLEDRKWDEDNPEDTKILTTIIESAKKEAKYLVNEVDKWEKDGRPQ